MKRLFAAMAIALTGAAIAAVVWVAATTQGTRWFLTSIVPLGGVGFSAQKIEGRIIDHLLLTGVRIGLPQLQVELDTLELRWNPHRLLAGTVAVQELTFGGVRIQDDAPSDNKPPSLTWPRVSGNARMVDGSISRLRVTNLSYRHLREQPVLVTSFAGSVTWQDGLLSIADLKAVSPSAQIIGAVSTGFAQPSLTADLAIALSTPLAEMDRFSLQVRRSSGTPDEQIAGMIAITGVAGTRKMLELGGDVGMVRNAFILHRLRLTTPGRRGVVTADGSLAFTPREPVLTLQVQAAGLDLAPELNVPTDLSGILKFAGTFGSYRGDFTLANKARGWQAATVSASYHGTGEGIKLAPFTARVLDGSLTGNLDIDWRDGIALRGAINGRNLNPARLNTYWKGVANFTADGELTKTGKAPVNGKVRVSLLESRLHGQELTGELQADFAGSNLSLARLALQGKGFDIHASGELNQRLNLSARIDDFSRLVPGSAGALRSEGWVRWSDGHLTGAVTGTGSNLAYGGNRIAAANLTARLDQGTGYPLHVAASLREVIYDRYTLHSVTVAADGTLQHHNVNAALRSDDGQAQLTLTAGYGSGLWKGEITRLSGNDGSGPWNLASPAAFAVSAEKFSLSPLALTASAAERLEVSTNLALAPLSGKIRAQWSGLNLARANTFLKEGKVSGSSSGTVRIGILAGKRLTLSGSAAGSGAFAAQGQSIKIANSVITFDGGEQGIRADVEFNESSGGRLKGTLSSSAPLRLAMPEKGELTAELSGIDLAHLRPWLPGDTKVDGRISSLALSAGYKRGLWKGEITRLTGSDATGPWNLAASTAFAVSAEKFFLSPLVLTSETEERLEVAADLALNPLSGKLQAQWSGLNLARANSFLKEGEVSGSSSGTIRAGILTGKRLTLSGNAACSGTFSGQGLSITIEKSMIAFDGSENGMRAEIELSEVAGGRLKGTFSSPAPLSLAMPEKGNLTAEASGIDLALLKRWLPPETTVEGRISGRAHGNLLPGQRFEADGNAALSGGALHQASQGGGLNLTFTSATATWGWRGEALTGTISMATAEHGQARADFQLPVSARFPVAFDRKGTLRASLTAQLQEKGIISALFPGSVQESTGEIGAELAASGNWEEPRIEGKIKLAKGGAYLPAAGIHLKDVQLTATLEKNLILIETFRAVSGPGYIEGTALLTLAGRQLAGYKGEIRGDNFQTVNFPELKISSTPKLSFEGTTKKLTLRGELRLPELNLVGTQTRTVVIEPSSDVVLAGKVESPAAGSPMVLDIQIRVIPGDKVFVKVEGIEAQLGGAIDLSLSSLNMITSRGEIKVVKGRYRTYGVDLDIVRGRLFFAGGSVDRPTLDFLALRTIGDVKAGVTVTGTLQKPVARLYSEPAMPDVDILAYIVLGHPLGKNGEQAGLVAQAAGALLTSSQADALQDKIKNRLGLSTLEVQGGVGGTTSYMGYKPLQVTPPGSIPAAQLPGITETMLTVGKYLTPQIYISYGRSLFTGSNLFRLRYDIFKQWQIETQTGSESGADLFYKMEFK